MMDPISALSLAANILQFIDFTSKLFSAGQQLHKAGVSQSELDLGLVVRDLGNVSRNLKDSLHPSGLHTALSSDDQALHSLASDCLDLSDELSEKLESLHVKGKSRSKWRTFWDVLKMIWQEDTINAKYQKLASLRNELTLRLSIITKAKVDVVALTQDDGFKKLDQKTAAILQKLVETPDDIISSLNQQTLALSQHHDQSDALAMQLHRETLSAVAKLQLAVSDLGLAAGRILSHSEVTNRLIGMLKFRQMTARHDDVAVAHSNTFSWILTEEPPNKEMRSFNPLLPWIKAGQGAYWVNGKAGSGKSTLMKFLGSSHIVHDALKEWAHPHQLITASFYFWRGGTPLQKSREGLLRWLLYTVLSQHPELTPVCFPDLFENLEDGSCEIMETTPTSALMNDAFNRLSRADLRAFKIFLFIDGVDELEGDHTEISQLFKSLASTPSFKILMSSRTTPACVDVFKVFPSLRLQDLTYAGIQAYVHDTIGKHERMKMLLDENGSAAKQLIDKLLSKASGVFLWVKLVVKSLLDGFRNYDRISDLRQRLDEMPEELSSLYLHMFRSMEPRYQSHAAELLRIVVRSIEAQEARDLPLTVLHLSLADEGNLSRALDAPLSEMSLQERQARCKAMTGRVRSRCCGLIEVRGPWVDVMHRSVLDFLAEKDVWSTILTLTPTFDSDAALIAACLLTIKRFDRIRPNAIEICLRHCRSMEKSTKRAQIRVMVELRRVLLLKHPRLAAGLLRQSCNLGLSLYVQYVFNTNWKEHIQELNIYEAINNMLASYRAPHYPPFVLSEDYINIATSLFEHTASKCSKCCYTHVLHQIILEIRATRQRVRSAGDMSCGQVSLQKFLLFTIEGLLERNVDILSFQVNAVCDSPYRLVVSEELISWLENLSQLLMYCSQENVDLLRRADRLREQIVFRQRVGKNPEPEWVDRVLPDQV